MFKVEKFDGINNFKLCAIKIKFMPVLHSPNGPLEGEIWSTLLVAKMVDFVVEDLKIPLTRHIERD